MSGRTGQTSDAAARVGDTASMRSAAPTQQRQRNDESWFEVSSQPSSSSVSSIGDEIVTTGLEVGSAYGARRRRLHPQSYAHLHTQHPTSVANQAVQAGACSSQEEYDETESEEDHVLTSSTENITSSHVNRGTPLRQVFPAQHVDSDSSDEDDDDENATALGRQPSEPFRPQPNAFSHPPSHLLQRHSTSSSIPQHASRPSFNQRSNTRVERRTPNFMSPSYQADNDAALRASLTTLLSCAAAARARPKEDEKEMGECSGPAGSNQPVELRFVPESELMAPSPPPTRSRGPSQSPRGTPSSPLPREAARGENIKRAATPTSGSKSPRAAKKKKTAALAGEDTLISPTLLTWVVSAGVVVLVSVVGFGAGYVIGREVGRQETLGGFGGAGNMSVAADGGSCGREVIRSSGGTLKRFRWGTGMGRSIAA
ncbi:Uu.00g044340.m01.CDS01 [Anthostomella pinea]|uniref:Uu.00g044340.m01.CDS01 n=1 Tax=Anthostomella pinea TaxID=933095 RepID=A0AAI8VBY8_9PEZI|nr:Uu.00g044340.m01.CDS01 [Anthostomella pinea]